MEFWKKRTEFLNNLDNAEESLQSRPGTAKSRSTLVSSQSNSIVPSNTLELVRPGTSNGRRHILSSSSTSSNSTVVDLNNMKNDDILNRQITSDNLLRIMNYDRIQRENEAILSVEKGDLEGLKSLVSQGLDIHACKGLNGHSLMHFAASYGHSLILAELFRYQIHVDIENDAKETPLHLAVYAGHILIVDQLLDYGANINSVNKDNETCLFYAARKSYPAIIRLLIQRGVDINIRDNYDDLAIEHVTQYHARKAFETLVIRTPESSRPSTGKLSRNGSRNSGNLLMTQSSTVNDYLSSHELFRIFEYFTVRDIMVAACVCSKWHRVSEHPKIWQQLGVRRWELALQNSLGFGQTATSSFFRPKKQHSNSALMSKSQKSKN